MCLQRGKATLAALCSGRRRRRRAERIIHATDVIRCPSTVSYTSPASPDQTVDMCRWWCAVCSVCSGTTTSRCASPSRAPATRITWPAITWPRNPPSSTRRGCRATKCSIVDSRSRRTTSINVINYVTSAAMTSFINRAVATQWSRNCAAD